MDPFALVRRQHGDRAHEHRSPMEPYSGERLGLYRPRVPRRLPRSVPDEFFDRVFAALPSDRDRALAAFWVSTGARALELLGVCQGDADPGQQLISVVRKGTRAIQQLPASSDAFVWLRLYQQQYPLMLDMATAGGVGILAEGVRPRPTSGDPPPAGSP